MVDVFLRVSVESFVILFPCRSKVGQREVSIVVDINLQELPKVDDKLLLPPLTIQ
jgi:hypothetical protein